VAKGTLLDAFPQKPKDYDNQLWMPVAEVTLPGYVFYQSKLTDEAGNPLVIDIQGGINSPGTPIDAWPRNPTGYNNQLWTLAG
jgi:hypothetical protein